MLSNLFHCLELNRTKNTHRKPLVVKASQQKSTIATVRKSARLKDVKKSKAAFREVLQCQNSTDLLIPKKAVQRVVSESANNIKNRLRFKKVVIVDLQEMSEAHLTDRFNKKDLLVTHSRRMTIR